MIDTPAIEKLLGELEALHEKATPGPFMAAGERIGGDWSITSDQPGRVVASVHPRHMRVPSDEDRAEQRATAELFAISANCLTTLITTIRALMEDNRRLRGAMERICILTNSDWIEAADNPVKHMERVHSVAVDAFWHKPGEVAAIRSKGDA